VKKKGERKEGKRPRLSPRPTFSAPLVADEERGEGKEEKMAGPLSNGFGNHAVVTCSCEDERKKGEGGKGVVKPSLIPRVLILLAGGEKKGGALFCLYYVFASNLVPTPRRRQDRVVKGGGGRGGSVWHLFILYLGGIPLLSSARRREGGGEKGEE